MTLPLKQIAEGIYNNITNKQEELFEYRISICNKCKLIKDDPFFGEVCNSKLWLNPITDELSTTEKEGFFKGCGCILSSKCRVPEAQCPIKKW